MELESVYVDPFSQESTPSGDSQRLDLENAVLMQELTALKVSGGWDGSRRWNDDASRGR